MTARIRSLNGGRFRIYWLTHGREAIRAAQLVGIVACFLVVSHYDYADAIEAERMAHRQVAEQLRQERAARGMPRVAWVIDSPSTSVQMRLAEIAGELDAERMRGRK